MAKLPEKDRFNRILRQSDRKRVSRGEDMYGYGEQKKKLNLSVTPTAIAKLTEVANEVSLSRSEVIEQLFRNHPQALISMLQEDYQKK